MNDVKKNFIYNLIYQILILLIPLITIPYVSRTIGVDGTGIYSYTYSIVYYFMIFAMLGLNNYGNRTIAKFRDDRKLLWKNFKEIYIIQIIMSLIMSCLYLLYILIIDNSYSNIATIQSLYILSCIFDINWFFFGVEKFKLTVTRNSLIKLLSLISIFMFVKTPNDVWKYTLILSGGTLLSQLLLWPFLKEFRLEVKIKLNGVLTHLKPCLKLFLPVIAVTIYNVMDKTMIGIFSSVTEVGYYENAERIISVPLTLVSALGTVMLPRMSNIYAKGDISKSKSTIGKSIKFIMFLSFAMTFGLMAIGRDFAILFFGKQFEKSGILIILLSITIIFLSWGNVLRTQFLIPKERDKEYIISAFIGAGVNFLLNIIFIPKYASIGACYGTIVAEFSVMLYQTLKIKNDLPIISYLKSIIPFLINSFIMFFIIIIIGNLFINMYIKILVQVLTGILVYLILNCNYILKLINKK